MVVAGAREETIFSGRLRATTFGLVTREYKLDEINQGYQDMRDGRNLRGLIRF